jgi:hypothetical protein
MSQEAVERVLGRLLTDDPFRETAKETLSRFYHEQGLELTPEEQSILQNLDVAIFAPVAAMLDKGIKRSY